jgi:XTP/dITP diphosphohydrolase
MKILIATQNEGKRYEYQALLGATEFTCLLPQDVGLAALDVDETGTTYEENAVLKAHAFAQASGMIALADDSGLSVDALGGAPGVYSARYGGPTLDSAGRRALLLHNLRDIADDQRTARFVCVIAVARPPSDGTSDDALLMVRGEVQGRIAHASGDGPHGFGYDPLFIPDGYAQDFSLIPDAIKNSLSHRGRAVAAILPLLRAWRGA